MSSAVCTMFLSGGIRPPAGTGPTEDGPESTRATREGGSLTKDERTKDTETRTNLRRELAVATALARHAGGMLLEEFHRPGGARGDGHEHAEIDAQVEDFLRVELGREFPDDGFKGEESVSHRPSRSGRTWVVDPNDGTKDFLRGRRGAALSIALVAEGRPVLGVVFSPAAPDDRGDLFTWAEGEPFLRNGTVVERGPLPTELGTDHVVLASSSADERPEWNARMVAPARFLAMPSIAYRLALVAAGDGDATFSLVHVSDWDVAGGHALLRAVDGVVLDERGRELEYDPAADAATRVFAGDPKAAADLARQVSSKKKQRGAGADDRSRVADPAGREIVRLYPLHTPRPEDLVRDAGVLSRAQGALLGQLVGDALGQMVEFRSAGWIRSKFPGGVRDMRDGGTHDTIAGQPTDDSEMALVLARSILGNGRYDREAAAIAYRWWRTSGPFDIGTTTEAALGGAPNPESKANGSLMRVSPLAILGWRRDRDELARDARADSSITHPNPTCGDAVAAFCVAIAHAIRTGEGPARVFAATADWVRSQPSFSPEVAQVFAEPDVNPTGPLDAGNIGYVVLALRNAFHQLVHATTLEEALVATVSAGGDTDTNGAIAGALLGAVHGRDAIPQRWRRAVLSCRPLPGTSKPRHETFWPVDALVLAEALTAVGRT